jgi:hypothetical protein
VRVSIATSNTARSWARSVPSWGQTMASSRPPFRADHVGSLLRPPGLKALRLAREAGTVGATKLRAAEDAAIRDGVKLQEDATSMKRRFAG